MIGNVTDVDDDLRAIAASVHVLSRTLRRAAEAQVDLDPLPASEFDVLYYVGAHEGSSVSEVARGLRLQTSNVSTAVRSLVERGLLDRNPDPHDQRRTRLTSSVTAQRQRDKLEAAWSGMLARLLDEMGEPDATHLRAASRALQRMAALMTAEARGGLRAGRLV